MQLASMKLHQATEQYWLAASLTKLGSQDEVYVSEILATNVSALRKMLASYAIW